MLAALVWPLVRLWLQSGVFGLVALRERSPVQRVNGALFGGLTGTFAALCSLLAVRPGLAWPVPPPVAAAGVALAVVGLAGVVTAQAQMGASWRIGIDDRPTALVERGLYRSVRHPIYTGVLLWIAGVLVAVPSLPGLALAAAIGVVVRTRARLEEEHLVLLHGDRYREYASRVGRFFPRFQ